MEFELARGHCLPVPITATVGDDDLAMLQYGMYCHTNEYRYGRILIVVASLLDRVLHYRYVNRGLHDNAFRQPCRIPAHSNVMQSSHSRLFCTS